MWDVLVGGMLLGVLLSCGLGIVLGIVLQACYGGVLPWQVRDYEKIKQERDRAEREAATCQQAIEIGCEQRRRLEKELETERSEKQAIATAHAAAEADVIRLRKLLIEIGEKVNAELDP